jgi:phenylacetate-coenzyme A ligase PaaK-like adenylate-forming protein
MDKRKNWRRDRGVSAIPVETNKSTFYTHLTSYEINDLADLSKLPFTYGDNLKKEPYKFLCVSLGEIKRIFTLYTSGTTGTPKKVFFTEEDLRRITDYMGAAMKTVAECAGLKEDYSVL